MLVCRVAVAQEDCYRVEALHMDTVKADSLELVMLWRVAAVQGCAIGHQQAQSRQS